MSTTPIFDQLCQELGDVTEPEVFAEAIDMGSDVAELEPESAPNLHEEETVVEWSLPEEYRDGVHRFDKFPTDSNDR